MQGIVVAQQTFMARNALCHAQLLTELSQALRVMSCYSGANKFVWINDY